MTSTIVPVRIKIDLPAHIAALREDKVTLTNLAKELARRSTEDYSLMLGYEPKSDCDQYAAQMFGRALSEVTAADKGVGFVHAFYGTWEHPLRDEDGEILKIGEKNPKPNMVDGRTFRFEDPTARLSGSLMLNIAFGIQNLVNERDRPSPRQVYTATINFMNGKQIVRETKPRSFEDKKLYFSMRNYF